MSLSDRDLARAEWRRWSYEALSPAELAVEIERLEQHRAILAGDIRAQDYSENDAATLANGIAYTDARLADLERQARRILRAGVNGSRENLAADFARAKYVDLIGLVETITAQAARTLRDGSAVFACPWHDDWEPSLRVYPPGRGWHCFQCGRGGQDAASFCAEFFVCSQVEGLRWVEELCDVSGVA